MIHLKHLFGVLCLGAAVPVMAQSNTLAAGGEIQSAAGSVSYSIGQLDYGYVSSGGGTANQGLQQPFEIFMPSGIYGPYLNTELKVYPNPSNNFISIEIGGIYDAKIGYSLHGLLGQQIARAEGLSSSFDISLEGIPAGIYLLQLYADGQLFRTIQIAKN